MNFKLWLFQEEQSAIEDGTSTIPEINVKKRIAPKTSRGEEKLGEILKKLFGEHDVQYKFDGCVNKQCLRFDASFLVKENNRRYVVEFHGQQHYSFKKLFHRNSLSHLFCDL